MGRAPGHIMLRMESLSPTTRPAIIGITVNGQPQQAPAGLSLADLLRHLDIEPTRVAVELNRNIVRKSAWEATAIDAGAQLEIVHFVGGG